MWPPDWGENKQQQAAQLPLLMVGDDGNDGVYSPLLHTAQVSGFTDGFRCKLHWDVHMCGNM